MSSSGDSSGTRTSLSLQLSTPKEFLASPGEPAVQWKEWKEYFLNYIANLEDCNGLISAERKKRILMQCLGPEGLRIYNQLQKHDRGDEDVFQSAILDLNDHFSPPVCIAVTRHAFFHKKQEKHEDIESYVSALKHLASSCRFAGLHDELVQEQIVMYTKNKSIQERLWIEGKSSLKDIIALVKKAELSERCAKITLAQDKNFEEVVAKVSDRKHNKWSMDKRDNDFKKEKNLTFAKNQKSNMPDRSRNECFRCGSSFHSAKFDGCPAKNAKCLECGIVGHFARVCRKKQMKKVNSKVACIKEVVEDCSDDSDEDVNYKLRGHKTVVLNISGQTSNKPLCWVSFGGVMLQVAADTGSPYSIVSECTWQKHFVHSLGEHLETSDISPESYTGDRIDIIGFRLLVFKFKQRQAVCKLYVAKDGPSVLGWKDQKKLHIVLDPNSVEQVLVMCDEEDTKKWVTQEFPGVFNGQVGQLKGLIHQIRLKKDAKPKIHKVRNIQFIVREEVKKRVGQVTKFTDYRTS
ncbi:hypothetical protein NDU88_002983 [Pleurodeles waltl]|uniref:CCHC-type domain-containing protein n=1 Tax=Pleurodeles waltl TaxID=8319 RepID=A0AAV7UB97_PLEWA|nr:hypothetical protein NDU88_002983 [Pleurodeles waltl]